MTVKGIVISKDSLTMARGMPLIRFTIEGARQYDVVAFDALAEKIDKVLNRGDRIEVRGPYSERFRNIHARKVLKVI